MKRAYKVFLEKNKILESIFYNYKFKLKDWNIAKEEHGFHMFEDIKDAENLKEGTNGFGKIVIKQ